MRRVVAVAAALAALALFFVISASPPAARAFPLNGCSLTISSYDLKGQLLSTASQGSPVGATQDNPVIVDPDGYVDYSVSTGGQSVDSASYHVEVFGMPTPVRGGINNANSTWSGRIYVADVFPFSFQGTIYVSGALEGNGSTICSGSAWVKINGNVYPGALGGGIAAMIGLAGVLWSARGRHPLRGILAGAMFGASLALLSGTTGIMPFAENTPIAEVVTSLIAGLAIGAIDLGDIFTSPGALTQQQNAIDRRMAAEPPGPQAPYWVPGADGQLIPLTNQQIPPERTPESLESPPAGPTQDVPAVDGAAVAAAAAGTTATVTATAPAETAPSTEPPAEPPAGLPQLRAWKETLPPPVKSQIDPVFTQGYELLRTGPGTLNISGQLINQLGAQAPVQIKLADGAILVGDGLLRATPCVENGKLSMSLVNPESSTVEFWSGAIAEQVSAAGRAVGGPDPLAGLNWFVDNVNAAVEKAGQSVQSIRVTPAGIQVTTGPAVH